MWVVEHCVSSATVNSYVTVGLEKPWINSLSFDDITRGGSRLEVGKLRHNKVAGTAHPSRVQPCQDSSQAEPGGNYVEDHGGRGDKQLKRGVFFLYSEMRHPPPRAGLYSHCGPLHVPASPSKGILTFPAPVQFQIYRMCRPRIPSKDMTGAGQQACSFVQNYLDYSALGRKARPRTNLGKQNRVFRELAPPSRPSQPPPGAQPTSRVFWSSAFSP